MAERTDDEALMGFKEIICNATELANTFRERLRHIDRLVSQDEPNLELVLLELQDSRDWIRSLFGMEVPVGFEDEIVEEWGCADQLKEIESSLPSTWAAHWDPRTRVDSGKRSSLYHEGLYNSGYNRNRWLAMKPEQIRNFRFAGGNMSLVYLILRGRTEMDLIKAHALVGDIVWRE